MFLTPGFFKCQLQHLVPNNLKRFLDSIYILFMTFRNLNIWNLSIWIFDVKSNVLFPVIILNKKRCSKCKPQFLAENLGKSLVLNGLCLVWPILDPKKYTCIDTCCQQVIGADSFKKKFFFGSCQPQKFEINYNFLLTSSVLLRVISG